MEGLSSTPPKECSRFGPMGMVHLNDLREEGDQYNSLFKVREIPEAISKLVKDEKMTPRAMLTALMIISNANHWKIESVINEIGLDFQIEDLDPAGTELTKDEARMIAQAISTYNAFLGMVEQQIKLEREKVQKECYELDHDLVPLRCLYAMPSAQNSEEDELPPAL